MRLVPLQMVLLLSLLLFGSAQNSITYVGVYLRSSHGPQVYKEPNSGTLFYVESDGRHVAAISADGKLLWHKDPFKDGHLEFYRTHRPQIVYIGPLPHSVPRSDSDKYIRIVFNSSQFGDLRISDGQFTFGGQD
jgi:hypothetical protein